MIETPPTESPEEVTAAPIEARRPGKKKLLAVALITTLVIGAVGVRFWQTRSSQRQIAPEEPTPPATRQDTTLIIAAAAATVSGSLVEVPVTIDTGQNTVSVVELHLAFDPAVLSSVQMNPGSFFTDPTILQSAVDKEAGTVTYILGSLAPRQGTGIVAILKARFTAAGETTAISFLPTTQGAAIGEPANVVRQTIGGTLTLSQ